MFFAKLYLVFGASIFDRAAEVVLDFAVRSLGFPRRNVCQYLDDVCAAAAASASGSLYHFKEQYRKITIDCGVKLAPATDPDKAFSPCTAGLVLGIHFDTVAWLWSIPQEKLARLLIQISNTIKAPSLLQHELWSLISRFLHYAPLVPGGRFYLNYIIKANATSKNKNCSVSVTPGLARQLESWALLLRATSGLCSILDPVVPLPAWTIEAFTV